MGTGRSGPAAHAVPGSGLWAACWRLCCWNTVSRTWRCRISCLLCMLRQVVGVWQRVPVAGAGGAEAGLPGGHGRGHRLHVHLCARVDHLDHAQRDGPLRPLGGACAGGAPSRRAQSFPLGWPAGAFDFTTWTATCQRAPSHRLIMQDRVIGDVVACFGACSIPCADHATWHAEGG